MSDERTKTKYAGERHAGSNSTAPYPVSRMAPAIELVDLAKEIAEADRMLNTNAYGKLKVIADQMRALKAEAKRVLEQTCRDQELHRARCNFKRIPGKVYHLYRKWDGTSYFSMLSPQEWGGPAPHAYAGSYRLENDMSWTPEEEMDRPDASRDMIRGLLHEVGEDDCEPRDRS